MAVGGRGTEATVLLLFAMQLLIHVQSYVSQSIVNKAIHSPLLRGGESRASGAGEGLLLDGPLLPKGHDPRVEEAVPSDHHF